MFVEADRLLARVAARQDGVVTRADALNSGLTARQVERRCAVGQWHRLARGIYVLDAGAITSRQRLRAVLLTLPEAVASHQTAAELLRIRTGLGSVVAITVPLSSRHVSRFATVHRSRTLASRDVLLLDGMAVTSRCRTLVDLSGRVAAGDLARSVDQQLAGRLIRLEELRSAYDRIGRFRTTCADLRQVLLERSPGYVATESELEAAFLALLDRHGLPPPVRQFAPSWLAPEKGRVDFAYPGARVVVEVDGRRWHTRDAAVRRDRWRDRQGQLAGWLVLRYGYEELRHEERDVAAEIWRAITRLPVRRSVPDGLAFPGLPAVGEGPASRDLPAAGRASHDLPVAGEGPASHDLPAARDGPATPDAPVGPNVPAAA